MSRILSLKFKSGGGPPQSKEPGGSEKEVPAKPVKFLVDNGLIAGRLVPCLKLCYFFAKKCHFILKILAFDVFFCYIMIVRRCLKGTF